MFRVNLLLRRWDRDYLGLDSGDDDHLSYVNLIFVNKKSLRAWAKKNGFDPKGLDGVDLETMRFISAATWLKRKH